MAHPEKLVARVKGLLLAGFKPKQVAHLLDHRVSHETIEKWGRGEIRADIEPDTAIAQDVRQVLYDRFLRDYTVT